MRSVRCRRILTLHGAHMEVARSPRDHHSASLDRRAEDHRAHGPLLDPEGLSASVLPRFMLAAVGSQQKVCSWTNLQIPAAEDALIEHKCLRNQTRLRELHIRIPAYAH